MLKWKCVWATSGQDLRPPGRDQKSILEILKLSENLLHRNQTTQPESCFASDLSVLSSPFLSSCTISFLIFEAKLTSLLLCVRANHTVPEGLPPWKISILLKFQLLSSFQIYGLVPSELFKNKVPAWGCSSLSVQHKAPDLVPRKHFCKYATTG